MVKSVNRPFHFIITMLLAALFGAFSPSLAAQDWSEEIWAPGGEKLLVRFRARLVGETLEVEAEHTPGYHTYDFRNQELRGVSQPLQISVGGTLAIKPGAAWKADPEAKETKTIIGSDWPYHDTVVFRVPVERKGQGLAEIVVNGQVCDEKGCYQFDKLVLSFPVAGAAAPSPSDSALTAPPAVVQAAPKPSGPKGPGFGVTGKLVPHKDGYILDSRGGDGKRIGDRTWLEFILACIGGGLIALLMPCVYPMIPITVSFFSKQAEATKKPTAGLALVYGFGLIASYTGLGFLLTAIGGTSSAVSDFGNHPWVASAVGIFFLLFALSMFGMFELRLPYGIAQKFNMQGKAGGVGGSFLLGTTFAVTSMACTVPVVAMILAYATQGNYLRPMVGMLVYSGVVALPFVVLASVPGLLKKMPKAGGWMNSVKVVFGFIELAAAAEFFGWANVISREVVLAVWVASFLLSALYLLGLFRSAHDVKVEGLSGGRIAAATLFGSLALWFSTGMYGGKLGPIEAFLRAESSADWTVNPDLKAALAEAKASRKPVFLDFTGPS